MVPLSSLLRCFPWILFIGHWTRYVGASIRVASHDLFNTSLGVASMNSEEIDPRFTINIIYGINEVHSISCLMTAINALAKLADLSYRGQIRELHITMVEYRDVVIDLRPIASGADIETRLATRLAVWGLYLGVKKMIEDKTFKDCNVALFWDDLLIGLLSIKQAAPPLRILVNDQNSTVSSTLPAVNATVVSSQLTVYFHSGPDGRSLDYLDVFATVLATLKDLAPLTSSQRMAAFAAVAGRGYRTRIEFSALDPPRGRQPYFQAWMAVEATRQLPDWLLRRNVWTDVGFAIVPRETLVGSGSLVKVNNLEFG